MIKKYWTFPVILVLLLIAFFLIYKKLNPKKLPPDLIVSTGTIDGDLVNINTKYPGRVEKLYVNEGDKVKKGQIIAKLYSREIEADKKALEMSIKAKENQLKSLKEKLKITQESLPENVKKAQNAINAAKAKLKELEKNINALEAVVQQDAKDLKRFKNLVSKELFPVEKYEKLQLKYKVDTNKLKALKEKKAQILASIQTSKSTLKQAKSTLREIKAIKSNIVALKYEIKALKAKLDKINVILDEMIIKSPVNGYIVDKVANEGEVLGEGMSIYTAIDPNTLYLKMFVDTRENAKVKIGDLGVIFLDGLPDYPIKAKIVKISRKAEFTPKEVAVREDRIQRVFAVHLKPVKPSAYLKLGLPAVGVISIDGKNIPKSLKELPEI